MNNIENDNASEIKSHLKPLSDGSYEIYESEAKSLYYVLFAFVLALASIYFLKNGYNKIIGNIFLAGFVVVVLLALKMVLFKKVVLSIHNKFLDITLITGFTDRILWEDIKSFNEVREKRDYYIAIMVDKPEDILETQQNKLIYKIMRYNIKLYNTPYVIHANNLNAHSREILELLRKLHDEYQEKGVF